MTAALLLATAALLVAFGGLMAAVDAALGVTSRSDLEEMSQSGRNAAFLRGIADDPAAHANAAGFMRVLSETTAAVLVTVALTILFDSIWWAMLAAAIIMTGISFVVVGASPRSVGRLHAKGLLRGAAPVIRAMRIVLGPLAHGLVALGDRVTPGVARGSSFASEEQLLSMVDEAASQDLIEEDDRELIHSVFDFTDTYVRAVMIPRTEMVTVEADTTTKDAMELFLDKGVSRVPVVDDEADDVIGMLYLKDLVQFAYRDEAGWRAAAISQLARPAVFVPESMRAETLLQQMKREAVHVCMVVDEYGPRATEIAEVAEGRYRVSARLGLAEVGELFDLDLEDDEVDSIGGLLGKQLGKVPQPGAVTDFEGLRITGGASRGKGRGITTVFVERIPVRADAAETEAAAEGDGSVAASETSSERKVRS